jgi:prephenate dehydrogenase
VSQEDGLPQRVGIVGAGLIGASVGIALSGAGVEVLLRDTDDEQVRLACALGAGRPWPVGETVDHAVLAVPPHAVAAVLLDLQKSGLAATSSDVASVKVTPVAEAEALGCDLTAFCPAHPVAGRERGGAASARGDLFRDRTWVLCPTPDTSPDAAGAAEFVARTCGAVPVLAPPEQHDAAMALLSHVPQVASSLLAGLSSPLADDDFQLAGQGFRDTTRLAESDPALWASILEGNRRPVADGLDRLAIALSALASVLRDGSPEAIGIAVRDSFAVGGSARRRLPTKVGQVTPDWTWVGVVISDEPGQLAKLFAAVGDWGVNIEDMRVEHNRDAPRGVLELAVAGGDAPILLGQLGAGGWTAYRRD